MRYIKDSELMKLYEKQAAEDIRDMISMRKRRVNQLQALIDGNNDPETKREIKVRNQYLIDSLKEEISEIEDELFVELDIDKNECK